MANEVAKTAVIKGQNGLMSSAGPLDAGSEHPKTNIPFTATIDGRMFNGQSISLTSAQVAGLAAVDFSDVLRLATLNFPFGSYSISVVAEVKVTRLGSEKGEFRLDFLEPTGNHLPTLRYIINSYVSGDIVSLGGVISQREKAASSSAAKSTPKLTFGQRLAVVGRALATLVLTMILIGIFGTLAYNRLLTQNVNDLAAFSLGGEPMRATVSGQLSYINAESMQGEVLYTILTSKRETVTVVNPCECMVSFNALTLGSTILVGETVAELVRSEAIQSVIVDFEPEEARRLLAGDIAQFSLPGEYFTASNKDMTINQIPGSEKVRASFILNKPVEGVASGMPVSVRIINGTFASFSRKLIEFFTMDSTNWFQENSTDWFQDRLQQELQQKQENQNQQEFNHATDPSVNTLWWRRYPPLASVTY